LGLILDSTLFIYAERTGKTPSSLVQELIDRYRDQTLALSAMTAGELLHGCWRAGDPRRRARREEFVEGILNAVPVVAITLPIMRVFGEVDAALRARGKTLPTSDLLIGCTAIYRGDEVVTGNERHFAKIPGLKVRLLRSHG
jgi:tRNA(fMet)-specific endonuclease VapC